MNNSNPYYFEALSDGLIKGFQVYNQYKSGKNQEKQQGFENDLRIKGEQRAGRQEQRQAQDTEFNQSITLGNAARQDKTLGMQAEAQADDMRHRGVVEADMATGRGLQSRGFDLEAGRDAWARDSKNPDNIYKTAEAAKSRREADPNSSVNKLRDVQAEDAMFDLGQKRDQAERIQAARAVVDHLEDAEPLITEGDTSAAFGDIMSYGNAVANGKSEGGLPRGAAVRAGNVFFRRPLSAMVGKSTKDEAVAHYFSGKVPEGNVVGAEVEDFKAGPDGNIHPVIKLTVKTKDGLHVAHSRPLGKKDKETGKHGIMELSIEDAQERVSSLVGFKSELAKHGVVTPQAYERLKVTSLLKLAAAGDKAMTFEALEKLGKLPLNLKDLAQISYYNPPLAAQYAAEQGIKMPVETDNDAEAALKAKADAEAAQKGKTGVVNAPDDAWGDPKVIGD